MMYHWHSHMEENFFLSTWKKISKDYLSYFHKVFSGYSTLTELITLEESENSLSDLKEV